MPSINHLENAVGQTGFLLQHKIHRPAKFVCQDGECAGFVVFIGEFFQPRLCLRILPQEQHRRFTERPFQVSVADFSS